MERAKAKSLSSRELCHRWESGHSGIKSFSSKAGKF